MKKVAAWAASVLLLLALAGCSGGETGSADLNQVMEDMKAVLENTEMMDLSQEDLMPQYGIDASQVKQFAVYIDSTGLKGDEIVLLEDGEVDVGDLARTAFILGMDTKTLCSEDCKGLCPRCGADLNLGPCSCGKEADPRLAVLARLLENRENE